MGTPVMNIMTILTAWLKSFEINLIDVVVINV